MVFQLFDQLNDARATELEERIAQARDAYYNGTPIVEDSVYDAWLDELKELREDSPQVKAVGAVPVSEWPKVTHSIPMGSLDKVQTPEQFLEWAKPLGKRFLQTEKLDGISVSLRYENGKLVQALTRGDGTIGEDITPNVRRMQNVLPELPEPLSVTCRGEIVLLKIDHQTHFPETSNPRNTASGTSKRYDGRGCEHLSVYVYQALDGPDFKTEEEQFQFLRKMGFRTPNYTATDDLAAIVKAWDTYQGELLPR